MSSRGPKKRNPSPGKGKVPPLRAKRVAAGRVAHKHLEHLPRRLKHLYEISKLFGSFEVVDDTFDAVLRVATETLPLRSAILIELEGRDSKMTLWPATSESTEDMRLAKDHARQALSYLVGPEASNAGARTEHAGKTELPGQARLARKSGADRRYVVIPLVRDREPVFGALQVETTGNTSKEDLVFINAVANQLAIALERDRARRREVTRRTQAELFAAENKRLYEEAQQAVRVREQVLAIVSHDLRNPLTSILMTAGGLANAAAKNGENKLSAQLGERMMRSAQRMQRLIEDLLDYASIEAGRLSIEPKPLDAGTILSEAVASFEPAARAAGIQLTAEPSGEFPAVFGDRDRILQLFSNLIGNAIKVVPTGGRITLRAEPSDRDMVFSVEDTGPGISPDDQRHLFERYWRGGDADYKGTGLGLAIAEGIARAHGGRIWVESRLGRGTTFFFTVPVNP